MNIKLKLQNAIEWLNNHPIQVFRYALVLLLLSFGISLMQYFFSSKQSVFVTQIPSMYAKSENTKQKFDNREIKMEKIVKELQEFKTKRDKGKLQQSDSLRIDYLFNQYQQLKNGL